MPIGAGLSSQLMLKKEATWGTRIVPTATYEYNSEGIQLDRSRITSTALRAGRMFPSSSRTRTTYRSAAGPIALDVVTKEFGRWLDLLHGNTVTPAQVGGTTAYMQTHNIGTTDAFKSATIQIGKPSINGTVNPFDYTGAKVTGFNFSCDAGGYLGASFDIDAKDRLTNQTLATAAYPSALQTFAFADATVSVNSVSITDEFSSFGLAGTFSRATDRQRIGSGQTKLEQIANGLAGVTCTLGGDFKDLTNLGLYDADTVFPVVVTFDSGIVAGGANNYLIRFTMSACEIAGEDPTVGGPDILSNDLTLTVLDDGTNPPLKVEYQEIATTAL